VTGELLETPGGERAGDRAARPSHHRPPPHPPAHRRSPPHLGAAHRRRRPEPGEGRAGPGVLVALVTCFDLIELRGEASYTPLLNDGSVHAQMVRDAARLIASGHLPLSSWYPFLQEGSPQFLHYQSLGAMLTGLVGSAIGADRTFSWSLYLLVSLFPIAVYAAGRAFGLRRWECAVAAACAPLLSSVPGIGYEQHAYLWIGFGVWAQLFAMWTLPFAWAYGFRAVSAGRGTFAAVAFISATVTFHFETGYLALLPLGLFCLLSPRAILLRARRALVIGAGSLLVSSWAVVPLLLSSHYAAINESLQHTYFTDSYGARQILEWLVSGALLDQGRLAVVTVLAAAGLVSTLGFLATDRARRRGRGPRAALVGLLVLSLLLFFGRTTWGSLIDVLPGSRDLFLRRFLIGVQLAAIYFAGIGTVALATAGRSALAGTLSRFGGPRPTPEGPPIGAPDGVAPTAGRPARVGAPAWRRAGLGILGVGLTVVVLIPAWSEVRSYDSGDRADLASQQTADRLYGGEIDAIVHKMDALGPGRVYAGLPTNWGAGFTVGLVPVFKYLSGLDEDVVGYTLRTASLMSGPETGFEENNPSNFDLFAVRYLVLPVGQQTPVPATLVTTRGQYSLWIRKSTGYLQVVETSGTITEDRSDVGRRNTGFLASDLPAGAVYPTVAFAGGRAATPLLPPDATVAGPVGSVTSESVDLQDGTAAATVRLTRRAALLLKATFDPGWTATVDGVATKPFMVAPALVAVDVGPGRHRVVFTYRGFSGYPALFAVSLLTLVGFGLAPRVLRRFPRSDDEPSSSEFGGPDSGGPDSGGPDSGGPDSDGPGSDGQAPGAEEPAPGSDRDRADPGEPLSGPSGPPPR